MGAGDAGKPQESRREKGQPWPACQALGTFSESPGCRGGHNQRPLWIPEQAEIGRAQVWRARQTIQATEFDQHVEERKTSRVC